MTRSAKCRVPRYLPDEVPKSPPADLRELWPRSLWPLIDFLQHGGADLPTAAFSLSPGIFIAQPAPFLDSLKRDLARGPSGPRARFGALQDDLFRLRELFGRSLFPHDATEAMRPVKPR